MKKKMIGHFQTRVLQRYMTEKELLSFSETYQAHLIHGGRRGIQEPSANDQRIVSHVRKTHSYKETAQALQINDYQIGRALQRVAAWEK